MESVVDEADRVETGVHGGKKEMESPGTSQECRRRNRVFPLATLSLGWLSFVVDATTAQTKKQR